MSRWLFIVAVLVLLTGCGQDSAPATSDSGPPSPAAPATPADTSPASDASPPPAAPTADSPTANSPTADNSDRLVELDRLALTAPAGWIRKTAGSSFVQAEFTVPKAEGDSEDGRLTVSMAGGTIEQNVDRWRGQFGGTLDKESQQKIDVAGLEVVIVDFAGEFNDQRGPFAPAAQKPGYRMLAAIIPVEGQLHFLKLTAPQKTVESQYENFQAFVKSVQKR